MKGIININIKNNIEIYIKASNLQGTMEGTIEKKDWNEILNKTLEIDDFTRTIKIKEYNINNPTLRIKMEMNKDTVRGYQFDLELKNNGNDTYSAKLDGPDLFSWSGIILHLTLTPFIMIYNKFNK